MSFLLRFETCNNASTRNQMLRNDLNNRRKWTCSFFLLTPNQILQLEGAWSQNTNHVRRCCAVLFVRCFYWFYSTLQHSRCSGLSVSLLWPDLVFYCHQMSTADITLRCKWNITSDLFQFGLITINLGLREVQYFVQPQTQFLYTAKSIAKLIFKKNISVSTC
jgi:hypothetical protein